MNRSILHIRIPSFFAQAERNRRPEIDAEMGTVPSKSGGLPSFPKPIIVAKAKGNTSGVVVSASAEAMKMGVAEGMSVRHARRSCPDAIVITADNDFYRYLFEQFLDILARCSPLLEPDPPDGAYLDVTGCRRLFGDPVKISRRIVSRVQEKLGLTISIGCASNRLLARAASASVHASGQKTSRRIVEKVSQIHTSQETRFISGLSVTALDSINSKTAKQLRELGITTVGQLAAIPEILLVRRFGPAGSVMHKQSLGIDVTPVKAAYPPDIIITEHTFACCATEPAQVEEYLAQITAESVAKLRKKGALAGEVALKLFDESSPVRAGFAIQPELAVASIGGDMYPLRRFPGLKSPESTPGMNIPDDQKRVGELIVASYVRFKKPIDSAASIQQALAKMLHDKMQPGMEIYRAQVILSDLTPGESSQLCLLGDGERRKRIDRAAELIRERFGEGAIFTASSLAAKGRAGVIPRIAA
jgi:DNA polymerase-4